MTPIILFAFASVGAFLAARRSLVTGLAFVLCVGYAYGIVRANIVHTLTHLMFDGAVVGLYLAQMFTPSSAQHRRLTNNLRLWVAVLIGWPTFLLAVSMGNTPLVEIVGWRSNVFLLPFLLLGVRLTSEDFYTLAKVLGVLNILAAVLAFAEFTLGLQMFFPPNALTEIMYRSTVLEDRSAFRIPASFSSAHAYAGTMVLTLPLLVGAWVERRSDRWHHAFGVAIVCSLIGVFMAAARVHTVVAGLLMIVATFSTGMRSVQRFRWAIAMAVVVYVVGGDARLQRFTTLSDTAMLTERLSGSLNEGFFEVISDYPLGNGLASGGTSVPYFLQDQLVRSNTVIENEYARIALEQGWPGLLLWVGFIVWALTRRAKRHTREAKLPRRLAWVACAAFLASGLIGLGMLSAIPQTTLMLLLLGWLTMPTQVPQEETVLVRRPVRAEARAS